jgi:Protein of unknown function (DUF2587)
MDNAAQPADLAQRPTAPGHPGPQVVVVLDSPPAAPDTYRIEDPGRLQRIWTMLSAADEELRGLAVPADALPGFQRQLAAITAELDRSLSPALVQEMHRLTSRTGPPADTPGELRVQYASLLGWLGAVILSVLNALQRASAAAPGHGADPPTGSTPAPTPAAR